MSPAYGPMLLLLLSVFAVAVAMALWHHEDEL